MKKLHELAEFAKSQNDAELNYIVQENVDICMQNAKNKNEKVTRGTILDLVIEIVYMTLAERLDESFKNFEDKFPRKEIYDIGQHAFTQIGQESNINDYKNTIVESIILHIGAVEIGIFPSAIARASTAYAEGMGWRNRKNTFLNPVAEKVA